MSLLLELLLVDWLLIPLGRVIWLRLAVHLVIGWVLVVRAIYMGNLFLILPLHGWIPSLIVIVDLSHLKNNLSKIKIFFI
jgi:hypothetical protein